MMKSNRRNFIQSLGLGAATLSVGSSPLNSPVAAASSDDQLLFVGDNIAVADTEYGKIRGFVLRGVHQFLGIPYGADTSGKNRFMPPVKPAAWKDIKPCVWWGNTAPQIMD
jgi:para-nitrobenzyl esterase